MQLDYYSGQVNPEQLVIPAVQVPPRILHSACDLIEQAPATQHAPVGASVVVVVVGRAVVVVVVLVVVEVVEVVVVLVEVLVDVLVEVLVDEVAPQGSTPEQSAPAVNEVVYPNTSWIASQDRLS